MDDLLPAIVPQEAAHRAILLLLSAGYRHHTTPKLPDNLIFSPWTNRQDAFDPSRRLASNLGWKMSKALLIS